MPFKILVIIGVLIYLNANKHVECFISASILDCLTNKISEKTKMDFGKATVESLSHEDIIRRGCIRSVARFFYDHQRSSKQTIDISNMQKFTTFEQLYDVYYGFNIVKRIEGIELILIVKAILELGVVGVDFDASTKDMPYAHFDAETFSKSNERVMNFTDMIHSNMTWVYKGIGIDCSGFTYDSGLLFALELGRNGKHGYQQGY
jgi:hypothetical protein